MAVLEAVILIVRLIVDAVISALTLFLGRLLPDLKVKAEDLTGKNVIVTGANSGIGLSIATSLARQNANVYLACRSVQRGRDAASAIIDKLSNGSSSSKRVQVLQLDTSDMASVRAFAGFWKQRGAKIDVLIHNAGIVSSPPGQSTTKDGLGTTYATNLLGSFLLTSLLEQSLAEDGRVIFTSSHGQYGGRPFKLLDNPGYSPDKHGDRLTAGSSIYADTKSMQVIFAKQLQRRWNRSPGGTRRVAHSFTPGYTFTPIFEKTSSSPGTFEPIWWVLKSGTRLATSVDVGAATGYWLASTRDPAVTEPMNGGKYWDRCVARLTTADGLLLVYGQPKFDELWQIWCSDSGAMWE